MAVSVFKTFSAGEVLTASDLNSSLTQITSNGEDLGWPATKTKDLDGNKLILDADADTSITADTDDQIDFEIAGADDFRMTANTFSILSGSTLALDAGAAITFGSGVALDMNGEKIVLDADGDTSITADSDDVIDIEIGGADSMWIGHGTGNTTGFVHVDPVAHTNTANTNYGIMRIGNTNAITVPAGTTAIVAGAYIEIPNWTATGTITATASLYVEGAATEGGTDYAVWVDAGVTRLDGNIQLLDATGILDSAGLQHLTFQETASAVNEFTMTNAAAGNAPDFSVTGDDADVDLGLTAKGVGTIDSKSLATQLVTTSITAGTTQTQAGATALTAQFNIVTVSGTDLDGVKLPIASGGDRIFIKNADAAQSIQVWPNTSDTIDGGSANAVDTNALEFGVLREYISDGATNWVTATNAAAAGGLVLIASVTASTSATVDFTSQFTTTYRKYLLQGTNIHAATDDKALYAKLKSGSSVLEGSSDYEWIKHGMNSAGTTIDVGSGGSSFFPVIGSAGSNLGIGNAAGEMGSFELWFDDPMGTDNNKLIYGHSAYKHNNGQLHLSQVAGLYEAAVTAVDGVQFIMESGNITSGYFHLYGLVAS
jgi:hypothetical protein